MTYETLKPRHTLCLLPLTALCFFSAGAYAQTTPPMSGPPTMMHGHMQKSADGSHTMMHSMKKGMDDMQKIPMSGDIDRDFAMMMKMHHSHAVEMAQMELAQGKSPEMKAMARKIITDQKKEIAQFDKWLSNQK